MLFVYPMLQCRGCILNSLVYLWKANKAAHTVYTCYIRVNYSTYAFSESLVYSQVYEV